MSVIFRITGSEYYHDHVMQKKGEESFYDSEFGKPKSKTKRPKRRSTFKRGSAFVIMSFTGQEMHDVHAAINEECKKLGLTATRADENIGSGFIIQDIVESIEQAEFIICDLTNERPNVYYELGYAHGVGNKRTDVLLIAKEGTVLHFDIAPLRVQYYPTIENLRLIVANNLKEMMRLARKQH